MNLLKVEKINKSYGQKQLLHHIDMQINSGEIVSIIGPNGSGKTTLLRLILGLDQPDSGRIHKADTCRLSYMPQQLNIDPTFPLSVKRFIDLQNMSNDKQWLAEIIQRVDIEALLEQPIHQLSGGEKQRVLLAQAILVKPQLMVLDEPAQGVDVSGQEYLYKLIESFRNEYHTAVLMVSHDLHFVMGATDKVICLNGHICCEGTPERISKDPHFEQLFGDKYRQLALYHHQHDHHHHLDGSIQPETEAETIASQRKRANQRQEASLNG